VKQYTNKEKRVGWNSLLSRTSRLLLGRILVYPMKQVGTVIPLLVYYSRSCIPRLQSVFESSTSTLDGNNPCETIFWWWQIKMLMLALFI